MLIDDNPFECGFDKSIHLDTDIEFLCKENLKKIRDKGITRKLMGVKINTNELSLNDVDLLDKNKKIIGELRSAAFSPKFKKIVGIAMVKKEYCKNKENIFMNVNQKSLNGEICDLPII